MPAFTKRDREVTRAIHKLFSRAWMEDKPTLIIWLLTRPAAQFVYHILIPFEVAYGLQSIIIRQFDQTTHHAILVLVYALSYCVLWGIGGVAVIRNARASMLYVQRQVFGNYLNKDYEFLNNTYLGSLGAQAVRLREALDEYDQLLFNGVVKQVIVVVSSIAIIAWQSPLLAVVTVGSMVLILSFTIFITRWRIKYRRILSEANSETAGVISDALGHGPTVKSFAAEAYEQKRLNASLHRLADAQTSSWMTSVPADIGRMFLAALTTFLLLILTARLYRQHTISIAIVVLVQLYVLKLITATQDIAEIIKSYEAVMSAAHQAVKTMLVEPAVQDRAITKKLPSKTQYIVELRDVSFGYSDTQSGVQAVKHFTLTINPGERVGLVGYSGSGKSTLTKLLLRFMDVSSGEILIDGINIRDLKQKDLRSVMAYVPQEPLLFHRSIKENIAYGRPGAKQADILKAGEAAYVPEFTKDLTYGYDTFVGEKGIKLSGGQRQRVAIARAILKDAPILILDEATSALDSKSERLIQKALWRLMKERTALVIAHRLSTIQRMDRIVVMDKGKIVQVGSHQELLRQKNGIYARLWAHQSGGYIGVSTTTKES